MTQQWSTEEPPRGVWLRIWWHVIELTAQWDGCAWRDEAGRVLTGPITHWKAREG